ncbi:hypothetical protein GCM10011348_17220 [Marinobacterium nitratireducens]|uniref:Uncharacterized protein n=1 Tax=Marinobacterium nitratireducens TaxID=518897 RepID=A0A918DSN7_9GAMM|nr:hypothetical protein [Marinobacterium nitratireducens]GGO80474.1 hypothetical protein GCM10011348_17220 [Marinobacterium nitratireducens]
MQTECTRPLSHASLADYFRDQIRQIDNRSLQEDTCWYLGNLLDRFSRDDALFSYQDGQRSIRPLALLYGDALEAADGRERCLILRHLGDMALFLGALFPEHYARRGIQRDYFIGMGSGAYDFLADNAAHHRHVFAELAGGFGRMLELVARTCRRYRRYSDSEIMAIYQRWQQSGNPAEADVLRRLGFSLDPYRSRH